MSVSIIKIKEDFHISDVEYGFINTGFLISYAIKFTVGGIIIDRIGSRKGLAWSVGIWTFATMLHSFANNALHFGIFRFFLGLGEGGAFNGAITAVVEWIPKNKRALANGIAIGGSALGAVIAPPLCVYLIHLIGWRGVFLVTSGIGSVWVIVWLFLPKNKNLIKKSNVTIEKPRVSLGHALGELLKIFTQPEKYHGKPGYGAGVEFKIKEGPITMLSINSTYEGRFKFIIFEGESVAGPIPPTGNTNTRGFFRPEIKTFLTRWISEGPTHHFSLGIGHHAKTNEKSAKYLNVESVIVSRD